MTKSFDSSGGSKEAERAPEPDSGGMVYGSPESDTGGRDATTEKPFVDDNKEKDINNNIPPEVEPNITNDKAQMGNDVTAISQWDLSSGATNAYPKDIINSEFLIDLDEKTRWGALISKDEKISGARNPPPKDIIDTECDIGLEIETYKTEKFPLHLDEKALGDAFHLSKEKKSSGFVRHDMDHKAQLTTPTTSSEDESSCKACTQDFGHVKLEPYPFTSSDEIQRKITPSFAKGATPFIIRFWVRSIPDPVPAWKRRWEAKPLGRTMPEIARDFLKIFFEKYTARCAVFVDGIEGKVQKGLKMMVVVVIWMSPCRKIESQNRISDARKHNRLESCINAMMADAFSPAAASTAAAAGNSAALPFLQGSFAGAFMEGIRAVFLVKYEHTPDKMCLKIVSMLVTVTFAQNTNEGGILQKISRGTEASTGPKTWVDYGDFYLGKKDHVTDRHCVAFGESVEEKSRQPPRRTANHRHMLDDDDIEADTPGRVSDDIGDPPGQQSVYIPPGDVRKETYRLSTFEQFPVTCPISRKSLAKSGFYFTGFYDRVKCFACGRTVERWESRDNPAELRWHKPDCRFPRGDPCGNVPINDLFDRLHSNPITRQQQAQQQQEQVLTQTDPNTGAVIRTVRYPADLPERIRRTGGTFQIGPGNSVIIQSGPGSRPNPAIHIGNENAPPPPRRWRMANVVSADHRRFLNNLYLNRELDRLTSFARWPVARPNVSPASLATTGFFYLGDMDRTQCFSCGGVLRNWTLEDDAQEEHRTHFPSCAVVRRTENRNVPVPEQAEPPENRMVLYPCRYPANPHMRSEAARLGTFDHRWPAGRIGATPAVIAEAGFFFLGERDRVKCWYCNGGLQNWEYDDMPWQEHSKWFPNCQFLLQTQGQVFVYRNLAMNPHLARPIIAKQEGATIDPAGAGEVARAQDIPPGGLPGPRQPSPPPTIIDPQVEMRKKKERIENIMKTSEICKNVILMGFSQDVVRRLLEERIDAGTEANAEDIYESASALLDDVMKKEVEMRREAEEEEEARNQAASMMPSMSSVYSNDLSALGSASLGPPPGSGRYNVSFYDEDEPMDQELYGSMDEASSISTVASTSSVTAAKKLQQNEETSHESLQEQLQKIEEERMCKICFSNTADMVFIPCSHMICCMECTQAIRQCPVCRTKIEKAIKTYVD